MRRDGSGCSGGPFVHSPRLAFRTRQVCDSSWALLPSAAGVIDPLLSTGFPLTLLGIRRLLDVLERTSEDALRRDALREYSAVTLEELEVTESLVAAHQDSCCTGTPVSGRSFGPAQRPARGRRMAPRAGDLLAGAARLEATVEGVHRLLVRSGFNVP